MQRFPKLDLIKKESPRCLSDQLMHVLIIATCSGLRTVYSGLSVPDKLSKRRCVRASLNV